MPSTRCLQWEPYALSINLSVKNSQHHFFLTTPYYNSERYSPKKAQA